MKTKAKTNNVLQLNIAPLAMSANSGWNYATL